MFGPVSSGYPGKYSLLGVIAFVLGLFVFAVIRFRSLRCVRSEGTTIRREDVFKQQSLSQILGLGVSCALLVGVCLLEIYRHWPN